MGDAAKISNDYRAEVALNADMGYTFAALCRAPHERLIRFNKSGPIMPLGEGTRIIMVHAEQSSEAVHTAPDSKQKTVHPGGEPCGYIIELENGFTIYHAGDTGVFGDMAFIGYYKKPGLPLLPIGGHFTMDPDHAAFAIRNYLKTENVVPMHTDTLAPLKRIPKQLIKSLAGLPTEAIVMQPGEVHTF